MQVNSDYLSDFSSLGTILGGASYAHINQFDAELQVGRRWRQFQLRPDLAGEGAAQARPVRSGRDGGQQRWRSGRSGAAVDGLPAARPMG